MAGSGGAFRSGKSGRTKVGGQNLKNNDWHVAYRGQDIDTTNFESNGSEEGILGIIGCDWAIKGSWDANVNPLANPPGLYPRDDGQAMILYTTVADGQGFSFPYFRVDSAMTSVHAGGSAVSFEVSGKNQGTFSTL